MKPVIAYTLKGKVLLVIIRFLLALVRLFGGAKWDRPLPNFHEDPFHYKFKDIVYFAYKYYSKPPELFDQELSKHKIGVNFQQPLPVEVFAKISISAGGDLMPYEWIREEFCEELWAEIGEDFFNSDLVMANLETPVDTAKKPSYVPELMLNDMEFNAGEAMFKVFNGNNKFKGFDVLSIANNHSFDKGEAGVLNTIAFLESKNIHHCGNASSREQSDAFPIIERNGIKVAFIACTYSLNHLQLPPNKAYLCNHIEINQPGCDLSLLKNQVKLAYERGADLVVGSMHYGNAYQLFPSDHIIETTHRLFGECGFDIIIGNHGHNIQPIEYYKYKCPFSGKEKQGLAAYCLGDFVAYDIFTWGHLPIWLKIEIIKTSHGTSIKSVAVNPVYTMGIYHSKSKRKLKFFDAKKLWNTLEKNEKTELTDFHKKEALYLKQIFQKVF